MELRAYIVSHRFEVVYSWSGSESQLQVLIRQGHEFIADLKQPPARFYIQSDAGKILHNELADEILVLSASIVRNQKEQRLETLGLDEGPPHVRRFFFEGGDVQRDNVGDLVLALLEAGYILAVKPEHRDVNLIDYLKLCEKTLRRES